MPYLGRSGRIGTFLDGDEVEPEPVGGEPEPHPPELGEAAKHGTFSVSDCLLRMSEAKRGAGLDLDKGHQVPKPGHEIQVVMSEPEAMGLDTPTRLQQVCDGDSLPCVAPAMPGVGPLRDRDGRAGSCHETSLRRVGRRSITGTAPDGIVSPQRRLGAVLLQLRESDKYFARLAAVGGPQNSRGMKLVDDPRRAPVADAEPAL